MNRLEEVDIGSPRRSGDCLRNWHVQSLDLDEGYVGGVSVLGNEKSSTNKSIYTVYGKTVERGLSEERS
jgi:hypothetical protein